MEFVLKKGDFCLGKGLKTTINIHFNHSLVEEYI